MQWTVDKTNPAMEERCASDYDDINGLEQQESIIEKQIKVNNNWSMDKAHDGENSGNTGNSNKCHCH
jgi:hypothetical protein